MTNLLFLLAALGVIALGTLILALRAREPKGFDSGIKAHQRHMNALSTETRKDSTGIDRIQPVRRVDPLTGPHDETAPPDQPSPPGAGSPPESASGAAPAAEEGGPHPTEPPAEG